MNSRMNILLDADERRSVQPKSETSVLDKDVSNAGRIGRRQHMHRCKNERWQRGDGLPTIRHQRPSTVANTSSLRPVPPQARSPPPEHRDREATLLRLGNRRNRRARRCLLGVPSVSHRMKHRKNNRMSDRINNRMNNQISNGLNR